ncbi:UDP-N-acetylglucosamine 2-epimerase (hydrolyzing) [candidate division KSB1 bacterium]|nr:UDP-N-acetylglucosamine 2-epimerase (hydrolyzing) [candidate division KSB1 bacterium]
MKKRKICVVTGTRAEYGSLFWLMKGIQEDFNLELQIIVTGMHLSPEFGLTYQEIKSDGFYINRKVEMLLSADTPSAISKSTGLGMIGFADAFADLKPDIIIVLGDRFEILAASISAMFARIPVGHIHGGETTAGAFDEAIRHSISKMAWWHFTAAEEYQKRVIQLGENPDRVFLVGGMGVDYIKKTKLLSKSELEKTLGFNFGKKSLLVTYHPVTLEKESSKQQFGELLDILEDLGDTKIIFTAPNADTDGRVLHLMLDNFTLHHQENTIVFKSMGQLNYLSTLQFVDGVVGNSSSGLAEAPTFKIGTVNIGDRQKGRLKADSVIDCKPTKESIEQAINTLYSSDFQNTLTLVKNPYGEGDATNKILHVLKTRPIPKEIKKEFFNL